MSRWVRRNWRSRTTKLRRFTSSAGAAKILTGVFFGTAFSTILTPGPNMMYVGTTGAQRGAATGILAALAIVLGGVCYTVMTAVGISALIAARPAIFIAIRVAGTLYLVWLGARLLSRARDTTPPPPLPDAGTKAFGGGVAIALTNPQLALFFLAFLPQFVVIGNGPVWLQLLKLGLTFNSCTCAVMMTVAVVTGIVGRMQGGVRFRQVMRAIAGTAFIALAAQSTWKLIG